MVRGTSLAHPLKHIYSVSSLCGRRGRVDVLVLACTHPTKAKQKALWGLPANCLPEIGFKGLICEYPTVVLETAVAKGAILQSAIYAYLDRLSRLPEHN